MTVKEKDNQQDAKKTEKIVSTEKTASEKDLTSEMDEPKWAVVTFENCAASGLTYEKAVKKLKKLAADKIAGLCIVTDEAAGRIKN